MMWATGYFLLHEHLGVLKTFVRFLLLTFKHCGAFVENHWQYIYGVPILFHWPILIFLPIPQWLFHSSKILAEYRILGWQCFYLAIRPSFLCVLVPLLHSEGLLPILSLFFWKWFFFLKILFFVFLKIVVCYNVIMGLFCIYICGLQLFWLCGIMSSIIFGNLVITSSNIASAPLFTISWYYVKLFLFWCAVLCPYLKHP